MGETLLYLVYGTNPDYQLELGYSVLSAAAHMQSKAPRIVLMTDEAGQRPDLPVEHFLFSASDFQQWTDNGQYNHACKAHAYIAALRHYGGKLAMIDTDTYFVADPMRLFDRVNTHTSIMHADEGTLDHQGGAWHDVVRRTGESPDVLGGITLQSRMLNSGVVACDASMLPLLEATPTMIDALRAVGAPFNSEQFAFAQVLLRAGEVDVCDDLVQHYWGFERRFIHSRIARLMPDRTQAVFQAALGVDMAQVSGFPQKSWSARVMAKIKGAQRRRQDDLYGFAYMAYLCALREPARDLANAWAKTALDVLQVRDFDRALVARDFRKLSNERMRDLPWIEPDTGALWQRYWNRA